jgi:CheY-like chemotaxis protein
MIHFIRMTNNLLIVTSDGLFAKRLSASLEQEGYRLYTAKGKGEAVVRADEQNCSTAFLDLELGEKLVSELGRALRTLNPTIKLILFSDEGTPPVLDELRPWALARKPVRTPELLTMLKDTPAPLPKPIRATNEPSAIHLTQESQELPWLQDVTKAAQHLTRLTLESSAQAALITRKDTLWAYAGQLSQNAAKELAVTVTRQWNRISQHNSQSPNLNNLRLRMKRRPNMSWKKTTIQILISRISRILFLMSRPILPI